MKHVTLFIVLLLVVASVSTLGFAGNKPSGTITLPALIQQESKGSLTDTDIPAGIIKKSSSLRGISAASMATSKLNPQKEQPIDRSMMSGLSGTYNIPGAFPNIASAVAVLNFVGLSGDATFELLNASYTEYNPVVFDGAYAGAGTYKLTIHSSINSAVNFISTLSEGKGFAFNGAKNVTLDGITVQYGAGVFPKNDAFGAAIYITNVSSDITIKNTSIKGQIDNPVWASQTDGRPCVFLWSPDADGDGQKHITFDNCTFTNATYAMKVLGDYWSIDNNCDYLTINNCKIGGAYGDPVNIGFFVEAVKHVDFTNNVIDGVHEQQTYWYNGPSEWDYDGGVFYVGGTKSFLYDFGQTTGAHFLIVDGGFFANNVYKNISYDGSAGDGTLTYGTRVYSYSFGVGKTAIFQNNLIYGLSNPGGSGSQINGLRGPAGYVYHNSIQLTGATASGTVVNCVNGVTTAYNNAFSSEMTGPSASSLRAIATGGTFDYNAVYSNGYMANTGNGSANAAVAAGINSHGTFGPVNFNSDLTIGPAGPSSAENIGKSKVNVLTDFTGAPRDTTTLGVRDAGAYEFADLGTPFGTDIFPANFVYPGATVPTGISVTPQVVVHNNSLNDAGSFDLRVQISPDGYDTTVTVASGLAKHASVTITIPKLWAISSTGTHTLTATTTLAGDVQTGNDVITLSTSASTPTAITTTLTNTFDAGAESWTATTGSSATTDWKRKSTFTKLGGPYSGSSWVTESPYNAATYTEGAYASTQGYSAAYPGANLLTSPWWNVSGMTGDSMFISFYQSINTEPGWDRSLVQYTTDGLNWKPLGVVNDPKGVNWYSTAVYSLAVPDPTTIDTTTAITYGIYKAGEGLSHLTGWTSNDDGTGSPSGPNGWVYAQLKIMASAYPDIIHAPAVRFRYVAFSDAATAFAGWAFDQWYIGNAAPPIQEAHITGKVYTDLNGNGSVDPGDDIGQSGVKIYEYYFGVLSDSATTDVDGNYSMLVKNPGTYTVKCTSTGHAFSVPFGSNTGTVSYTADGVDRVQNFGLYDGSVSGNMFDDVNDNGALDAGEPGVSGWTIEVHKDSANGAFVAKTLTDANGNYQILVPPYTYGVKRIAMPTIGRATTATSQLVTISGSSGSPSANVTGVNFGDFIFGVFTTEAVIDQNGNGVKDLNDIYGLAAGNAKIYYRITKDGSFFALDSLSDGVKTSVHSTLDKGTYGYKRISAVPAGWIETTPDTFTVVLDLGGMTPTVSFMYFHYITVSGHKFNDLNGNGVMDSGEPGLADVTINLSGNGGGSMVTDVNGNFTFANVGPGSHTVSETVPTGWTRTFPATPGTYTFNALSGHNPLNLVVNQNFGNFKNIVVSGLLFRDRNNNGVQDAGEEGLSGWDVTLTPGSTIQTGTNGEFSFAVGPTPAGLTLDLTVQTGWTRTFPTTVPYAIVATSGVDVTGQNFGVFKGTDATTYRTFTVEQLQANTEAKPVKAPKAGKPYPALNTATLLAKLVTEGAAFQVGLSGQLNADGKELAYLKVAKQADAFKTFNAKGTNHSWDLGTGKGAPKPFALDNKGKLMLKMWKAMGPDKKNDVLAAQLLALQINLWASQKGHTDAAGNLGALLYTGTGPWGAGPVTIDYIADYADNVMTNWEGVAGSTYVDLYNIVKSINEAFAGTSVTDTTQPGGGWNGGKYIWKSYKTVYEVAFLKAAVAPAKQRRDNDPYKPVQYALGQNYPNPFNPTTTVSFDIPVTSLVTLKIYNILGQEVATLLNREEFSAGQQDVDFDASRLASGVYLYQIVAEQITNDGNVGQTFTQVKKMVLMK